MRPIRHGADAMHCGGHGARTPWLSRLLRHGTPWWAHGLALSPAAPRSVIVVIERMPSGAIRHIVVVIERARRGEKSAATASFGSAGE